MSQFCCVIFTPPSITGRRGAAVAEEDALGRSQLPISAPNLFHGDAVPTE